MTSHSSRQCYCTSKTKLKLSKDNTGKEPWTILTTMLPRHGMKSNRMTGKSPVQTSGVADLDGLEVEVVVQMQVVEILAMDEEVQHVVTLATHLQPNLDPVQHSRLEELGRLEGPEQIPDKKKKKDHCQQMVALKNQNKYLRIRKHHW